MPGAEILTDFQKDAEPAEQQQPGGEGVATAPQLQPAVQQHQLLQQHAGGAYAGLPLGEFGGAAPPTALLPPWAPQIMLAAGGAGAGAAPPWGIGAALGTLPPAGAIWQQAAGVLRGGGSGENIAAAAAAASNSGGGRGEEAERQQQQPPPPAT